MLPTIVWWCQNGASHRKILTLHPFEGRAGIPRCTSSDFKNMTISGALGCTCEIAMGNMAILKANARRRVLDDDHTLNRIFPRNREANESGAGAGR